MGGALLKVENLSKSFHLKGAAGRKLRAVHNVSFELAPGQTLGLVGESGCGKSTLGRLILRLIEPDSGSIKFEQQETTRLPARELRKLRSRMQIVFQDPLGSLNPRHTVERIVGEPLLINGIRASERRTRVRELFADVELPPEVLTRYPHEFSGGQRQRIAIARALALRPNLIIADEPVSALDASIQSQILMLLKRLQNEHGLAYLFISHDLSVVRYICHYVAVMYLGEIVEYGPVEQVFQNPQHPYTRALLAAVPQPSAMRETIRPLEGSLPSAIDPPVGCSFASRCSLADERCRQHSPPQVDLGDGHQSKCWRNEGGADSSQTPR